MADAQGQQGCSPYHAMACNPSTMVDPLGLATYMMGQLMANPLPGPQGLMCEGNFVMFGGSMLEGGVSEMMKNVTQTMDESHHDHQVQELWAKIVATYGEGSAQSNSVQSKEESKTASYALPLSGAAALGEYLKSVSLTTGIEVSVNLTSTVAFAARALSLTFTAVAIALTAGAGSSLADRDEAIYKFACTEVAKTGRIPLSYVHGNSNNNRNPHGVYVIYTGSGIGVDMQIQKYGITGNVDFPQNRPQNPRTHRVPSYTQ